MTCCTPLWEYERRAAVAKCPECGEDSGLSFIVAKTVL